ncbi:hypothetical protein ACQ33O_08000 [Ferruginibacter sp. SUN002]|uniref:hypothetical protein n=1 Tax=Ferruginibacter sp. SUN002 TaxID=2937789 RepID=UPI003D3661B4
MKFITSILLIALLSLAACMYLPWWSIAIVAFIVAAAIPQNPYKGFLSGFIALFFLWGVIAYVISINNDDVLAHKVSLLVLKVDSPMLLITATALIGAMVAGFAALAGSYLRENN